MNFTFNRVDFVNTRSYDEKEHSTALFNGLPNFAQEGLFYDETTLTLTNGRGVCGGVPFIIGTDGEVITLSSHTGYVVVRVTLNALSSVADIILTTSIPLNTSDIKYFAIWELSAGSIVNDLRHQEYIKDLYFKDLGSDSFALVINGKESPAFDVSVIQNSYSKTESDNRYWNVTGENGTINSHALFTNSSGSGIEYGDTHFNLKANGTRVLEANENQTIMSGPDGSSSYFGVNDDSNGFFSKTNDYIVTNNDIYVANTNDEQKRLVKKEELDSSNEQTINIINNAYVGITLYSGGVGMGGGFTLSDNVYNYDTVEFITAGSSRNVKFKTEIRKGSASVQLVASANSTAGGGERTIATLTGEFISSGGGFKVGDCRFDTITGSTGGGEMLVNSVIGYAKEADVRKREVKK